MTFCLAQTLSSLSAQEEPIKFGSLRIFLKSDDLQIPTPLSVKMDREVCGETHAESSVLLGPKGAIQNVIVWVEGERVLGWPDSAAEEPRPVQMEKCDFSPRVVITPPKGRLVFTNLDPILHTIRAHGQKNFPVFRSHPPNLRETSIRFDQPEIVPIMCDLHPWMKMYAVIAPHQNYGISDGKGVASISQIPYGHFKVKLWHEVLGSKELETQIVIDRSSQDLHFTWSSKIP